ncbi:glutathione S-transferase family protein [Bradyrhizobium diazoefficiens]|nr:glutathione S-transferase family protein [Bradyrhizobium diazoefficiens]QQN62301.1 glutathione S-transferase family protein [Bradyrhizobium diazoefficiens]
MGLMLDGRWHDRRLDSAADGGRFVRSESQFRNWITADGKPGPSGSGGFRAETGRYHLYVSLACPWAHRTLIFQVIKGLEDAISVSIVHWLMGSEGWTFEEGDGVSGDPVNGARRLYEVYSSAAPSYSGRVTVPVLWDKKTGKIVSNESPEIIRMLNSTFDEIGATAGDYYPSHLRKVIDQVNEEVYTRVNNGVYRAGFATTQEAYEEAVLPLFETLDRLERLLAKQRYLCGDVITEADWRLFTTLVRFDLVYVGHFKCNIRRLVDYPNLWAYTRELYQWPGVRRTTNFDHIKLHYYQSHETVNPKRIVPIGPDVDFSLPHGRGAPTALEIIVRQRAAV